MRSVVVLALLAASCTATVGGHGAAPARSTPAPPSASTPQREDPPLPTSYRAARPGQLPAAGAATVDGVVLPPGHLVRPDPRFTPHHAVLPPVSWVTDRPVPDLGRLWVALSRRFPDTGLWPIIVENISDAGAYTWADDVGAPDMQHVGKATAAAIERRSFADQTAGLSPGYGSLVAPYQHGFPGLAAAPAGPLHRAAAEDLAKQQHGLLALVAVTRPADAVAALGWAGVANYDLLPGEISTILRSWEDRYDAVIVVMGFDAILFSVGRPVRTHQEATRAAAERIAACSDQAFQNEDGLADDARLIESASVWPCWWD